MTREELTTEWEYSVAEYLGTCRDDSKPETTEQRKAAIRWADEREERIKHDSALPWCEES